MLQRFCGQSFKFRNRSLVSFGFNTYDSTRISTIISPSCSNNDIYNVSAGHFFSSSTATTSVTEGNSTESKLDNINERSVEEQYIRKTPLEHVLLRPGMYVGPTERLPPIDCWVLDPSPKPLGTKKNISFKMIQKEYGLIPALQKVFDEILVNATDNQLRHPKSCTLLDVSIEQGGKSKEPIIRIWNNGKGIPIKIHKEENMYLPEMLFGHLLTGSNFDDTEKRLTGGRHGYGAKLSNIFSKSFTIETVDCRQRLHYKQTWTKNMTEAGEPQITTLDKSDAKEDYTCISFVPDIQRLSGDPEITTINNHDYALMCRRVVDAAGCAAGKLEVILNGHDVSMESFADYINLYRKKDKLSSEMCYTKIGSRWNVGIGLSDSNSFVSVSFVNGMFTSRGGTHINAIINQVVKRIQEKATKSDPSLSNVLTPGLIRRNIFLACNAYIENPTFDSQMKDHLTSNPSSFGSSYTLTEKYLKELVRTEENGGPGIVEEVLRVAKGQQQANLFKQVGGKKTKRQLLSIPKLEDAHNAGSNGDSKCTLILTEGDSAKALAVAGLEIIGRDKFGVFPLRGKFLNVRTCRVDQLSNNAEVKALFAILGLNFDKEYDTIEERNELRYSHIMLMTDQDEDGSHIKGLVINFFRHFWPKLLKPAVDEPFDQPFLSSFATPLLKAIRKNSKKYLSFYSVAEYNAWRASLIGTNDDIGKWKVKFYKGLGTSTPAEAKEYFSAFDKHHVPFIWKSELDGELLDKVFDKSRAADRRDWITSVYDPESTLSYDAKGRITYEDFVNKEMIHFSNSDNVRSIPSVIDGLKPSQRKVLHACFKRKLKSEIKVAQLSGYCAEHTAYHHGEASLQSTIIGMAQDFVGSNNINLLVPSGQFGTRLAGGEDAASPRYIFTHLSPITRYLFPEDDDMLLDYLEDDGQSIEPKFFCPIIPLLLVNGTQGIGTGWSTFIPQHKPLSVVDYIRAKLDQTLSIPQIEPYSRGFEGVIDRQENGYASYGRMRILDDKTIFIDELPIGIWTNNYKTFLLKMQEKGTIVDFKEDHTTTKVSFTVKLKSAELHRMQQSGLEKAFKLNSNLPMTNMNAFDDQSAIQKFVSAESIADTYFPVRMSLYHDRKSMLMSEMNYKTSVLENKARFIQLVSEGQIELLGGKMSKDKSFSVLESFGFSTTDELNQLRNNNSIYRKQIHEDSSGNDVNIVEQDTDNETSSFDYLFKMPLSSLTSDRIGALKKESSQTTSDLNAIRELQPEEIWLSDLDKLAQYL